jgi:hypothetical protein
MTTSRVFIRERIQTEPSSVLELKTGGGQGLCNAQGRVSEAESCKERTKMHSKLQRTAE